MEAHVLLGCLAVLSAFGCAALLASSLFPRLRRNPAPTVGGSVGWRMRNGVRLTKPLARVLLRVDVVASLMSEAVWVVRGRGYTTTEEALLSVVITTVGVAALLAGVISASPIGAVAVAVCLVAIAVVWVRAAQDKRRDALRDAVPEALRSMGVCFQSGLSLLQTLQQVAREAKGPLKVLFEQAAHRLETGRGAEEALETLRRGSSVSELAFVAVALDVQHQAGGSMKQVLDAARDTVEGEIELRRSLRVQTAQAKLSARVVSVMPFVLIALFSLVSEGFLAPFFSSPMGLALLALALGMQAAGIMTVRRMLAVEVT